jgi:hypothetical protein
VCGLSVSDVAEVGVDLAGGVPFEAAHDLFLGQALGGTPVDVGPGRRVGAHPGDNDPPQGVVGLPVAGRVEAPPDGLGRGCRDRGYGAQVRPGGLGPQPLGVVPSGDEQDRGGVGADAVQGDQARSMTGDQGPDEVIQALDLAAGELGAPPEFAQGDPGVVADDSAGPGPQGRQLGDQVSGSVPGEPGAQVLKGRSRSGPGPG